MSASRRPAPRKIDVDRFGCFGFIHDIEKLESNVHAGIKYNRWIVDNF